jgi:hypothetical protein
MSISVRPAIRTCGMFGREPRPTVWVRRRPGSRAAAQPCRNHQPHTDSQVPGTEPLHPRAELARCGVRTAWLRLMIRVGEQWSSRRSRHDWRGGDGWFDQCSDLRVGSVDGQLAGGGAVWPRCCVSCTSGLGGEASRVEGGGFPSERDERGRVQPGPTGLGPACAQELGPSGAIGIAGRRGPPDELLLPRPCGQSGPAGWRAVCVR